jgi:hypothetical protein
MHMRIEIARESSNGVELVHVNAASVGIIEIVTDVKIDNLTEHQAMWAMSNRDNLYYSTFHTNGCLSNTRRLHLHPWSRGETSQGKFIDVWRILT